MEADNTDQQLGLTLAEKKDRVLGDFIQAIGVAAQDVDAYMDQVLSSSLTALLTIFTIVPERPSTMTTAKRHVIMKSLQEMLDSVTHVARLTVAARILLHIKHDIETDATLPDSEYFKRAIAFLNTEKQERSHGVFEIGKQAGVEFAKHVPLKDIDIAITRAGGLDIFEFKQTRDTKAHPEPEKDTP